MSDNKTPGADNLYDMQQYYHAKKVAAEFPKILNQFHKTLRALEPHRAYTGVWDVCEAIEEAQTLMKIQLAHFEDILSRKGKA